LAEAQLLAGISRAAIITVERLGVSIGPGSRVCPRSGVEKERGAGIDAMVVEAMQEERLAWNAVRPNCIPESHRSQSARRIRRLDRKTALVMEDAVGCPTRKQKTLPAALREAEPRDLIIEVEVKHLRLVDSLIG